MPRVTCAFCGLPFSVRSADADAVHYCCSGCALASRIPVTGAQVPVTRGLLAALGVGFGLFNQVLFLAFGAAIRAEERWEPGTALILVGVGVGALLWSACIGISMTVRATRASDAAATAGAVLGGAGCGWVALADGPVAAGPWLLAVNVLVILWLARGWVRRGWRRLRHPAE